MITRAPSKSCKMDPIPTDVLKKFLPELLPYITDVCNSSLQQGSFPLNQRHAIIRPRLKKPGSDPSDIQNYRPVSNLTFVSKVVEKLVCHQLVSFFERLKILPTLQSAYRKNHSTETAVLKMISDVLRAADRGEVTLLCMLDLSCTFDTVDHGILLDRLRCAFGIQGVAISWIESFLQDRTVSSYRQPTVVYNEASMRRTTGQHSWANTFPGLLCGCNGYCSSTWPWSTLLRRRQSTVFSC